MKRLFFAMTLLCAIQPAGGQVIPPKWIGLIHPNGDTSDIVITQDFPATIDYYLSSDSTMKKRTSTKANPAIVYREYGDLTLPLIDGQVKYVHVVNAPGKTKDQLFTIAKLWFSDFFTDSKEVLEVDDRSAGILSGTGWGSTGVSKIWTTIKIEVKDGRYRYSIEGINLQSFPDHIIPNPSKIPIEDIPFDSKRMRKVKERLLPYLQRLCDRLNVLAASAEVDEW